jgi:peptide-methionine (S)-S-oxide reductase
MMMYYLKSLRPLTAGVIIFVIAVMLGACALHSRASDNNVTGRIHTSQPANGEQVAVLAGGCFWAMQAMFSQIKGVNEVVPGYAGGKTPSPTYEEVCTHTTGYAETIRIVFDPKVVSYRQLLTIYFSAHDPTTLNRQGDDEGTNYRSAIFYKTPGQKADALDAVADTNRRLGGNVVVTEVVPFTNFYAAEEYHNHYFALHPDEDYCATVVAPKVAKFQEHWRAWLK